MSIKVIIIDDEEMARTLLKGMLETYCHDIEVIDVCPDLPTGVKQIRKLKPDIVFLDIEMPNHSGLEILDFFNPTEINFEIIFTTAYHKYAVQAFKLSAIDYLLKPISIKELQDSINRYKSRFIKTDYTNLKHNLNPNSVKKISLPLLKEIVFVSVENILYFQAEGSYTQVYLVDGNKIVISKVLKTFESMLQENHEFIRCHKSYIVNATHITNYVKSDGGYLIMNGGHHVSVSPDKINDVLNAIT